MKKNRHVRRDLFTGWILGALVWSGIAAQAASIHADKARQMQACRDLVAIIGGTQRLEESFERAATPARIRLQIKQLDETYRRLRGHAAQRARSNSLPVQGYDQTFWYRPAFRRAALRQFRDQARGYNCTQILSGRLGMIKAKPGETRRSFRKMGFWSFWNDTTRTAALAFLSLAVVALFGVVVRDRLEKRREKRYIVRIKTIAERDGRIEAVVIHNISRGGAKVRFLPIRPFRKGERLALRIGDVFVPCSVVWVGEGMAGLRFARRIHIPKAYVTASRAAV